MESLTPQLVAAGRIRMSFPGNDAADEHFENLRREYADRIERVRDLADELTDSAAFVKASGESRNGVWWDPLWGEIGIAIGRNRRRYETRWALTLRIRHSTVGTLLWCLVGPLWTCRILLLCCGAFFLSCGSLLLCCGALLLRCDALLLRCDALLLRCDALLLRCSGLLLRCSGLLFRCGALLLLWCLVSCYSVVLIFCG